MGVKADGSRSIVIDADGDPIAYARSATPPLN